MRPEMIDITLSGTGDEAEDLLRRAAFQSVAAAVRTILEPLHCPRHRDGGVTSVLFEPTAEGLEATMDGCCEEFVEEAREQLFAALQSGTP
jgi:hypothetical protein